MCDVAYCDTSVLSKCDQTKLLRAIITHKAFSCSPSIAEITVDECVRMGKELFELDLPHDWCKYVQLLQRTQWKGI